MTPPATIKEMSAKASALARSQRIDEAIRRAVPRCALSRLERALSLFGPKRLPSGAAGYVADIRHQFHVLRTRRTK